MLRFSSGKETLQRGILTLHTFCFQPVSAVLFSEDYNCPEACVIQELTALNWQIKAHSKKVEATEM